MSLTPYIIALVSGLFAGISPCVLPIYPALIHRLTRSKEDPKWVTVFFTLGLIGVYFTLYAIFGALTTMLGSGFLENALEWRGRLALFGAIACWLMAYATFRGGLKIPAIRLLNVEFSGGYFSALASGFVYGTFISPCNAPFMFTGILPALTSRSGIVPGLLMLAIFSIAMAAPLLLLGFASAKAMAVFGIVKKNIRKIEVISAVFLALAGFYFLYLFTLTL